MKILARILIVLSLFYPHASPFEAKIPVYGQENDENGELFWHLNHQLQNNDDIGTKDFFLASFPKSGSHLIIKLLVMMTGKTLSLEEHWQTKTLQDVQRAAVKAKRENQFLFLHLGNRECQPFNEFWRLNPTYIKVVQVRDFRDSLVSLVHHFNKTPIKWKSFGIEEKASFGAKLKFLISQNPDVNGSPILDHAKNAVAFLNDPHAVVIRFEDLVGPLGGGDLELQQQTISNLANSLGIELSSEKLTYITDNLFGTETGPKVPKSNFRSGQIGSWEKCFDEEHIQLFNNIWGFYQKALGYPLAE